MQCFFRIIAGPGSGKTRVLTSRVEYLIQQKGCKPWELVVITFSNKAAKELQDRLDKLLGPAVATKVVTGLVMSDAHPHLLLTRLTFEARKWLWTSCCHQCIWIDT